MVPRRPAPAEMKPPFHLKLLWGLVAVWVMLAIVDGWIILPSPWHELLVLIGLPVSLIFLWASARWARQGRRARAGLCAACGYDLRATPGRCPECGRVAEAEGEIKTEYHPR